MWKVMGFALHSFKSEGGLTSTFRKEVTVLKG